MKNKKIKSIKLAKDYRGLYREVLKGTVLEKYSNAYLPDIWRHGDIISFYETQILNNETGLFEIEYEDEFIRLSVKVFECLSYKQFKRIYQNRIKSIPPRTAMKMTNKTFKKFKKAVFGK